MVCLPLVQIVDEWNKQFPSRLEAPTRSEFTAWLRRETIYYQCSGFTLSVQEVLELSEEELALVADRLASFKFFK